MSNNRVFFVDLIRIVAIFLVVLTHASGPVLSGYGKVETSVWLTADIYNSLARACVPLFFMISGYLLLRGTEPLKIYYQKRLPKILVPFIFWTVFYILFSKYVEGKDVDIYTSLVSSLKQTQTHLWFLYPYLGLLISVPILRVLVQNSTKQILELLIVLWLVQIMIVPDLNYYFALNLESYFPFTSYIGYFILGYLLGNYKYFSNKELLISFSLYIAATILIAVGLYLLTVNDGKLNQNILAYSRLPVFLQSAFLFLFLKSLSEVTYINNSKRINRIMIIISTASFGIYLVHPMFLRLMIKGSFGFELYFATFNAIYSIPLTAIVGFIFSLFFVLFLQRIPILKALTPK